MISYLKGKVISKTEKAVILLINNVGYQIYLAPNLLEKIKLEQELAFFIFPHIKEDAWDFYGFETEEDLEFFKLLLTVSGIGPKSALNIVSGAKINDIKKAIISGDDLVFQKITGVGKKNAEKIIVELKNKIAPDFIREKASFGGTEENLGDWQTIEALVSLGYNEYQVRNAVKKIPAEIISVNERIKEALKILGGK